MTSIRKRYCALGLGVELGLGLELGLGQGLAETRFRTSVVDPFLDYVSRQLSDRYRRVWIPAKIFGYLNVFEYHL